jgi:HSP20 family protein
MARNKDAGKDLVGFSFSVDRMLSSILLKEQGQPTSMWRPPTDVYETLGNVVILIEIAGMDPDKIEVEFSDKILRVHGQRVGQRHSATCHCLEVQYGEFSSEVYLPGSYDLDGIEAEYKDGFLTITLPKVKQETRLIAVQTTDKGNS